MPLGGKKIADDQGSQREFIFLPPKSSYPFPAADSGRSSNAIGAKQFQIAIVLPLIVLPPSCDLALCIDKMSDDPSSDIRRVFRLKVSDVAPKCSWIKVNSESSMRPRGGPHQQVRWREMTANSVPVTFSCPHFKFRSRRD